MSTTPDVESQAMHDHSTRFQFGTPIGVDFGRRQLIAAAPATVGIDLDAAITIGNRKVEGHYATLQERHEGGALTDVDDDVLAAQLDAVLTTAANEALAYAQSFDSPPMLALEDLDYAERSLAECVTEGRGPRLLAVPRPPGAPDRGRPCCWDPDRVREQEVYDEGVPRLRDALKGPRRAAQLYERSLPGRDRVPGP